MYEVTEEQIRVETKQSDTEALTHTSCGVYHSHTEADVAQGAGGKEGGGKRVR